MVGAGPNRVESTRILQVGVQFTWPRVQTKEELETQGRQGNFSIFRSRGRNMQEIYQGKIWFSSKKSAIPSAIRFSPLGPQMKHLARYWSLWEQGVTEAYEGQRGYRGWTAACIGEWWKRLVANSGPKPSLFPLSASSGKVREREREKTALDPSQAVAEWQTI